MLVLEKKPKINDLERQGDWYVMTDVKTGVNQLHTMGCQGLIVTTSS